MTDLQATTGLATGWLDRRSYPDLPKEAERALRAAALCWQREVDAEAHLARARELAPGHVAVLIADYRYRLYKHRFAEAREAAVRCLSEAAARLQIPNDFRQVGPGHAAFGEMDPDVRFWLFTLQAYGYVSLRAGHPEEGRAALEHLAALDTADQTKTRILIQVIAAREHPDD
jgi:hypothetical protein